MGYNKDENKRDFLNVKWSFIVPTYNAAVYIDQCIGSIYNSCLDSNSNAEIIIIDDGTYDKSSEKIDGYFKSKIYNDDISCSKISLLIIHTSNRGVSCARNTGLKIASGEYIVFIDSDDDIESQKMFECINILLTDSRIDMLIYGMSFDYYRKETCYKSVMAVPPFWGVKNIQECRNNIDSLFDANALSSLCNRIIKRDVINGIYLCEDLAVCEDLEFSLRVLANCRYVYFYNEPVYHYRQCETESNSINRLKGVDSVRYIVDKIEAALLSIVGNGEHILTSVYGLLAIDKIKGLQRSQIKDVCAEYKLWIDSKGYHTKNSLIYSGNVKKIVFRLFISRIRHQIANTLKAI